MKFDNQKTTIRIFLRKMFIAIFFAVLIVFLLMSNLFHKPVLGFSRYQLTIAATILYILIVVFSNLILRNYIFFSDEGDKIIIRYYPIRPIGRKKRAVEIPKIALDHFEVRKSFLGIKKSLILYRKIKGKVAKYPPISITSLTKEEYEMLITQLEKYVRA